MLKKFFSSILIVTFTISGISMPQMAQAAPLLGLPEPGKMVSLSPAFVPAMIKGVTVNKDNPFQFDFIVDVGQDKLAGEALKAEGDRLIKYFLASLAIPQQDLWVNLSPYEKDKTVPEALGQTDMGRDLLAQDYILKQVTASLIYPEKSLGKSFWDRVYAKSQELYGNTQIPVNTFNKVWITADQAEVFEHGQTAFVTKSHLKVLLETDYLAQQKNEKLSPQNDKLSPPKSFIGGPGKAVSGFPIQALGNDKENISSQIIRDIILPELEREVNEGKNFANLRQIFNSLILASWYKNNLKDALLTQVYANQSTVKGIDLDDKTIKEAIYTRYLQAYKKGVFNFVKEDTINNQIVPKKYFSGGVNPGMAANPAMTTDRAQLSKILTSQPLVKINVEATTTYKDTTQLNQAMMSQEQMKERFQSQIMTIFELLRQESGLDEATFLEELSMDQIDSDFHQLYVEQWREAGLNDQTSHIKGESEAKKHNYLQSYFGYNFIIDSFSNTDYQDIEYANFVKWKYLESFLLVFLREKYSLVTNVNGVKQDYSPRSKLIEFLESELKKEDSEIRLYIESIKELLRKNDAQSLAKLLGIESSDFAFDSIIQRSKRIQVSGDGMDVIIDFLALTKNTRDSYESWRKSIQSVNQAAQERGDLSKKLKSSEDSTIESKENQGDRNIARNSAMTSTSEQKALEERINAVIIQLDEVSLVGFNPQERKRFLELTQESVRLKQALKELKAQKRNDIRVVEVNTALHNEDILAIINNWMAAGKRRFNLTKNYYTEKIRQSTRDEVVLFYVGEKYNPAGILLGFLDNNHWVIEIVEVEKSEMGSGSGDLLVKKFIELYGQEFMIELDIDYIGSNISGLNNWRQKLKSLGFYGTETQLYRQPTNLVSSIAREINTYEYPVAMQSSKKHNSASDILIIELRKKIQLRKSFNQQIHENLDGIALDGLEDPLRVQAIIRQLIEIEYENSKLNYEKLRKDYDRNLFIKATGVSLDQLKKLREYYLSLEKILQSSTFLPNLYSMIEGKDKAQSSTYGGIDLKDTVDNIAIKKENGDSGVQMVIDVQLIERIKREGIASLKPVIFSITPILDVWKMIGLTPLLSSGNPIPVLK